jgi:K+-transporting ATPase ATPase A chain
MLSIFMIPAGLTYTFGKMVKDTRQGWAIFAAFSIMFLAGVFITYPAEQSGNPNITRLGINSAPTATQAGGNMEGKETRFGVAASALFATVTTDTSCGAVNSWHDSFTPIGGLVPLANMQLGEVVFGGVGTGLYGMVLFVVLTVFIAGLMVGRTPEYLGKKIERKQVQLAMIGALILPLFALVPTALSVVLPQGTATLTNSGPHGFSELLYGFTSTTENNGSAFGGLGPNMYLNILMGAVMLCGRYLFLIPAVLLAGSMAGKPRSLESAGTFTTHSPIFVALLIGVIIIVGALTFFPADALGPIVEHLRMLQGQVQ